MGANSVRDLRGHQADVPHDGSEDCDECEHKSAAGVRLEFGNASCRGIAQTREQLSGCLRPQQWWRARNCVTRSPSPRASIGDGKRSRSASEIGLSEILEDLGGDGQNRSRSARSWLCSATR
jgi:hypothetical protein